MKNMLGYCSARWWWFYRVLGGSVCMTPSRSL